MNILKYVCLCSGIPEGYMPVLHYAFFAFIKRLWISRIRDNRCGGIILKRLFQGGQFAAIKELCPALGFCSEVKEYKKIPAAIRDMPAT